MQQQNVKTRGVISYIIAALFLLYEMAVQTSPSIMTNQLMHDLHVDGVAIGLISAAYFYSYSAMQIPAGLILDRLSIRNCLSIAILFCATGSFMFAKFDTAVLLAIARFFMGLGSAFAFISVLTVAHRWFSGKVFALLVGIAQLLAAIGAWAGEYPLSFMINHMGWRHTMLTLGFIGVAMAIITFIFVRDRKDKTHEISSLGIMASLKKIFSNTQTFWIAIYAFCSWSPIIIFAEMWGVPFLVKSFNISTTAAASACGAIWLGLAVLSPILGYLSNRIGKRCILLQTSALVGLIGILVLLFLPTKSYLIMLLGLLGIGIAAAGQILSFALVRDINSFNVTATAIAFNNLAVVVGGALLHPIVGFLLRWFSDGVVVNGVPQYSTHDYRIALAFIPVCYVVGFITSRWKIKETYCKSIEE
jgi:MFS family permease